MSATIKKFRIKSFKKNTSILKLEKISLKFGKKTILDSLNLNLNEGEWYDDEHGRDFIADKKDPIVVDLGSL